MLGQARVNMRYHKTEGGTVSLMVGLVITHPRFGKVFFHSFDEHNGPQEFYNDDCPCPVDTLLVTWLQENGIGLFYAYDEDGKILYRAKVAEIATAPIRSFATRTARVRHMLPRASWTIEEKIELARRGRAKVITKGFSPLFTIPWIEQQVTLNPA